MPQKILFLILLTIFCVPAFASETRADQPFVILELYTSQGCASCPIADKIFAEIAQQENVIALGCHVTYWDHRGWKDTFGLESCTKRQHSYKRALEGKGVYTPQMVFNGSIEVAGTHREDIAKLLKLARSNPPPSLPLTILPDGSLRADLSALDRTGSAGAELVFVAYDSLMGADIRKGENRGKALAYANVVRILHNAGAWNGAPYVLMKPLPRADHYAMILQEAGNGKILAAGMIREAEPVN